jgi:hypothetical protein
MRSKRYTLATETERGNLEMQALYNNILLSRLIPQADEIIWDHQCGFRLNRLTDQIFYIRQILEKNGNIMAQYISDLWILRKPTIQLGRKYYTTFSLSLEHSGN